VAIKKWIDRMKHFFDVERTGSSGARLLNLAINCVFAGAFTGIAIAIFGYAPRPLVLAIIPYAIFLGGLGGGAFAFLLCYFIFGGKLSNATFHWVTITAIVVGALGALILRFRTGGGGGWLGAVPSMIAVLLVSLWFRFSKKSESP
jgi:hypothetical protein